MTDKFEQSRFEVKEGDGPSTKRTYLLQSLSTVLIFAGLFLVVWGLWTPLNDYMVLLRNQPPPPPPPEASNSDLIGDDTPLSLSDSPLLVFDEPASDSNQPSAFDIVAETPTPTAIPQNEQSDVDNGGPSDDSSMSGNPLPVVEVPTETPSPTTTPEPADTATPLPTASPTALPTNTVALPTTRAPIRALSQLTGFDGAADAETTTRATDNGTELADQPASAVALAAVSPTATPTKIPEATATTPPTATATPRPTFTVTNTPLPPTASPTPNPFPPAQSPPTRIVIPAIDLDSPVKSVGWTQRDFNGQQASVWDVAEYAAGWHKNSAQPGHTGNIVLSGHHNILGEVFRHTVDLEPGDIITLYTDNRPYIYKVEDKFIVKDKGEPPEVRQANARWIGQFPDQRLTMITCWPYNNNTHRVVVIAKPFF